MDRHLSEIAPEREAAIRQAFERVAYARWLGLELVTLGAGTATVRLTIAPHHKQNLGVVHGGATASLIDTASAMALLTVLNKGEKTTTTDLSIQYLRPLTEGEITAHAIVRRAGRRVAALSVDVYDVNQKLAATAITTYLRFSDSQ